jgi:hypothetical protein
MSEQTRPVATAAAAREQQTGLEDVMRSVRSLARSTRDLSGDVADVLEREIAMVVSISQQVRDRTVSEEMLTRVRGTGLASRLRRDAHDIVDLVADLASVVAVGALDLAQGFVDERRPPIKSQTIAVTEERKA